jgi:putative flavoprotein involved in K+ transport
VRRQGRAVYLSVGRSWWKPAWYRGRDNVWWKTQMGGHDRPAAKGAAPSPVLTGQDGGRTLNLHTLARGGVSLLGRMDGIDGATLRFLPDVERQVAAADAAAARGIAQIDAFVAATGMDAPPDDGVRDPALWTHPDVASATALDLGAAGITTVIWATGYRLDFDWVRVPAFDEDGYPEHEAGVALYEGLYFPALPGRDTFLGVVRDAAHIAASIVARTAR